MYLATKNRNKDEKAKGVIDFSDVSAEIKAGVYRKVYLIYGDEAYLSDRIVAALRKNLISPGSEAVDYYAFEVKKSSVLSEDIRAQAYTPPFLSARRMVVVRNQGIFTSDFSKEDFAKLDEWLRGLPDSVCIVFLEEKIDKRKKAQLQLFLDTGAVVEVVKQQDAMLCRWVAGLLKRDGISITIDAINSLISRNDSDMLALQNDIEKIILYCQGSGIDKADSEVIEKLCAPDIRGSVFQMTDAIGLRKVDDALRILDHLVALKEPVPRIRFMLSRHIRQLICAKDIKSAEEIIQQMKVLPFVARNLTRQASGFSRDQLVNALDLCFQTDLQIKTGQIDEKTALEVLLISVSQVASVS